MADGAAPSPATIADGPSFRAAVCVTFCACSAAPSPATIADGPSFRAAVCVTFSRVLRPPALHAGRRHPAPVEARPVLAHRRCPARGCAVRRTRDRPPRARETEVDPTGATLTPAPNPPKNNHRPPAAGCWPREGGSCDNPTSNAPPRRPEARSSPLRAFLLLGSRPGSSPPPRPTAKPTTSPAASPQTRRYVDGEEDSHRRSEEDSDRPSHLNGARASRDKMTDGTEPASCPEEVAEPAGGRGEAGSDACFAVLIASHGGPSRCASRGRDRGERRACTGA